jgi:hypothetical protein
MIYREEIEQLKAKLMEMESMMMTGSGKSILSIDRNSDDIDGDDIEPEDDDDKTDDQNVMLEVFYIHNIYNI